MSNVLRNRKSLIKKRKHIDFKTDSDESNSSFSEDDQAAERRSHESDEEDRLGAHGHNHNHDNDDHDLPDNTSISQEETEYEEIRKELADMPFEDLIKLKNRLGTKLYNKIYQKNSRAQSSLEIPSKGQFARENKNRPREMSSKKKVSIKRDVIPVKKKVHRDPRFDDLSGEYKEEFFKNAYSFLGDLKSREMQKVKKKLKKEKNDEKRSELKQLYDRMKQQERTEKVKEKQKLIEREWKKKEQERVKEGKSPFYLKKAEKRKLELAEKYRELKKSGGVDKYLMKRRKKTAQREKKNLPNANYNHLE